MNWVYAIFKKELQQLLPLIVLGMLLLGYLLLGTTGLNFFGNFHGVGEIPFHNETMQTIVPTLLGLIAAGFGLFQPLIEHQRGTWLFLLHRPISRRRIMAAKLVAGGLIFFVATGLPFLIYYLWAITPGMVPAPVVPVAILMVCKNWIASSMLYLGGYLAGLKSAAWFGTRLLPVFLGGFMYFLTVTLQQNYGPIFLLIASYNGLCLFAIFGQSECEDFG